MKLTQEDANAVFAGSLNGTSDPYPCACEDILKIVECGVGKDRCIGSTQMIVPNL
jgi:hypothetical protein